MICDDNVSNATRIATACVITQYNRAAVSAFGSHEDTVQEAMRGLVQYPPPSQVKLASAVFRSVKWVIGNRLKRKNHQRRLRQEKTSRSVDRAVYPWNDVSREEARQHARAVVDKYMERLPLKFQLVLSKRFGLGTLPHTLAEVGEDVGLTRQQVQNIERQALNALRRLIEEETSGVVPIHHAESWPARAAFATS